MCMLSPFRCVQLSAALWTAAHQAPLSMGFSRQEYWRGLPLPSSGDPLDSGVEPASPALGGGLFAMSHHGSTWRGATGVGLSLGGPIESCWVMSAFWGISSILWLPHSWFNRGLFACSGGYLLLYSGLPPKRYFFMNLLLISKETSFPNISGKCSCNILNGIISLFLNQLL